MIGCKRAAALILVLALCVTSIAGQAAEFGLKLNASEVVAVPRISASADAASLSAPAASLAPLSSAISAAGAESPAAAPAAATAASASEQAISAASAGESDAAAGQMRFDNAGAAAEADDGALPTSLEAVSFDHVIVPGESFDVELKSTEGPGAVFAGAHGNGGYVLAVTPNAEGTPYHTGTVLKIVGAGFEKDQIKLHLRAIREVQLINVKKGRRTLQAEIQYHDVDLAPVHDTAAMANQMLEVKRQLERAKPELTELIHLAETGDARLVANNLLKLLRPQLDLPTAQAALSADTISERIERLMPVLESLPSSSNPAAAKPAAGKSRKAAAKASKSRALVKAGDTKAGDDDRATIAAAIRKNQSAEEDLEKEVAELREKIMDSGMPEKAREKALKELKRMQKDKSERDNIEKWLELMTELPWTRRRKPNIDLKKAAAILNESHAGLDDVKKRMLTDLAVQKRTGDYKGRVIALEGPPGVGKTTLAEEYAKAADRDFIKLSLGGKSDEKYLRGIPRFYHNSYAGALIDQLRTVSRNAVVLLDEADTAGGEKDGGGLMSALLELLDEKGNLKFTDSYLGVPFDFSEITFIVTGNKFNKFPEAVRSRMQTYYIGSYSLKEKMSIGRNYAYPKTLKRLKLPDIQITDEALKTIIEQYTFEAGVRQLEFKIDQLLSAVVFQNEFDGTPIPAKIDVQQVAELLGPPSHGDEQVQPNDIGRASGLGVSDLGGSLLSVQARLVPGSGQLVLSGEMEEDMRKSAMNAYVQLKARAKELGLDEWMFKENDMHVYIAPSGPIGGPSAGLVMATAMLSAATGRPVLPNVAMTGAVDLYGTAWTIGGLREKVLAAERQGYKKVLYPATNHSQIGKIPDDVRGAIELVPVKTLDDVLEHALGEKKPEPPAPDKPSRMGFLGDPSQPK